MLYDVHILAVVRVKRTGIEAESQEEAIKKAKEAANRYRQQLVDKGRHNADSWKVQKIESKAILRA